jgi:DNA (cytosine-5)-methyltransferase 1
MAKKIVSLFAGAGGLDLGMIKAGHQVIWANDNDADAVETYKHNIGNHIVLEDISKISSSEIPDCDVVIGGFPCQGFSQANLLRSSKDKRNSLYLHFCRVITEKQPDYFLAENVRGILSLNNGHAIKTIKSDFRKTGYRVSVKLFNVADYGVPQRRFRVIIAGTKTSIDKKFDYQYPEPTHSHKIGLRSSLGLKPWVTISDALDGIPEPSDAHNLLNHICSNYKVTNRNFTGHRTTNPDKPSPTILARGNGKGGVCALQHPRNHRRMSIREQAKIQTFPLDFHFIGSMSSCYRQVGNAVPVEFAEHLGSMLL